MILLVFCRMGAMMVILPAFGETYISPRFRLLVALAITLVMVGPVAQYIPPIYTNTVALILLIMGEVTIGFFLGFILRVIFNIFSIAGTILTYMVGFANAQLFNPVIQGQGGLHAALLTMAGIVVLQASNLHHYSFVALVDSYILFTPGEALFIGDMASKVMITMAQSFAIGFKLCSPFILAVILFYALMGIMSRLMPQLQIFFLSQPIQILGGTILFILLFATMMTIGMEQYENLLFEFIQKT
jgi:flagellar biosynthetic protein FliR